MVTKPTRISKRERYAINKSSNIVRLSQQSEIDDLPEAKGGNAVLRAIHDLDIKDKHATLILLVSAAPRRKCCIRTSCFMKTGP